MIDDFADLLMFISDLLASPNLAVKLQDTIQMSLLNFAYLPVLAYSLTGDHSKVQEAPENGQQEILSMNTCLFLLLKTFEILRGK